MEVEINQEQYHQLNKEQHEAVDEPLAQKPQQTNRIVPDIPVIRSNTPRPLSVGEMISSAGQKSVPLSVPNFPARAPSAPPLPEELGEIEEDVALSSPQEPLPDSAKPAGENAQDFFWLFEYGLEMDTTILNSPERLDGLALFYGPALLKGYSIVFGSVGTDGDAQTIVTIVPDSELGSEVWGVLYRIPRRVTEGIGTEPSLLDTIHGTPQRLFKATQIIVQETYRDREVACVTYVATEYARQQLHLFPLGQGGADALFVQRLAAIARKHKLPERYTSLYTAHAVRAAHRGGSKYAAASLSVEQNTDPLPILKDKTAVPPTMRTIPETPGESGLALSGFNVEQKTPKASIAYHPNRWLVVFALYLMTVLLAVLTFAVLQAMGFANHVLTPNFMPLNVPWLVLVYGLMGGCMSSIITLGRSRLTNPPLFIIITWFARPYIGVVLAVLAYLILTSGIFIGDGSGQHSKLFLLAGALAGLCEGWIFSRHS